MEGAVKWKVLVKWQGFGRSCEVGCFGRSHEVEGFGRSCEVGCFGRRCEVGCFGRRCEVACFGRVPMKEFQAHYMQLSQLLLCLHGGELRGAVSCPVSPLLCMHVLAGSSVWLALLSCCKRFTAWAKWVPWVALLFELMLTFELCTAFLAM